MQQRIQWPGVCERGRGAEKHEKHEIYVVEFGGHIFYDLFLQNRGGGASAPMDPLPAMTPLPMCMSFM